jgi:glycine dehydrogenase subunit 2
VSERDGRYVLDFDRPQSIGRLHPFLGNVGVILRAFAYLRTLGSDGLEKVSRGAIVNANYLMKLIQAEYPVAFPGPCMHEFVVSTSWMRKHGVKNGDVAKRLLDFGVHAPTVSFPLIVPDCLMIEPTESESRSSLDEFAEILLEIAREAREEPATLLEAPQTTPVRRLDEGAAARNLIVRWAPKEKDRPA